MDGYAPLIGSVNGGYPDSDYVVGDYPHAGFPTLPQGSAESFIRERQVNIGVAPTPLFPGEKVHSFRTRFGNINRQLENDPGYIEKLRGRRQNVYKQVDDGINAKHVDPWNIHAGDVNLNPGWWEATSGDPRDEAPRGGDLVAAGPVVGYDAQWSGYVAQLRIPQAGQPGPVAGRIGTDYIQSVQAANAPVLYSTQLSEAAINAAVLGVG